MDRRRLDGLGDVPVGCRKIVTTQAPIPRVSLQEVHKYVWFLPYTAETVVIETDDDGMGESAQRGFSYDQSVDGYTSLYRLVLTSYGYRCALTGARFAAPTLFLHADLDVEAIQPREQGGPLSVDNYLPMIKSLRIPFRDGLITIENDYRIIAPHPDLLDSDMLASLRGSLLLPEEILFRPGAAFLAYHRRYALGR